MGRHAKAFTRTKQLHNAKLKQKDRRNAPHGRELKAEQRYRAYWKLHGRQGSSIATARQLKLPSLLLEEALEPLPEASALFREASESAENLDETGLEIWDTGPPYPLGPSSDSQKEKDFTERLVEVMHGRRLRIQREQCAQRPTAGIEVLMEDLEHTVTEWDLGRRFMEVYDDGHRELAMARLWRQWLAREAYRINAMILLETGKL